MKNNNVYSKLYYHLIWSTKNRTPILTKEIRPDVYKYIGRTITMKDWHLIAIGGIEDHIHILIQKRPSKEISYVVSSLKSSSSRFIKKISTRILNGKEVMEFLL